MNLYDPVKYLDWMEDWITQDISSVGWKLERLPAGKIIKDKEIGRRTPLVVENQYGEDFRFEPRTRWVATRPDPKNDDKTIKALTEISELLIAVWAAREALRLHDASASLALGLLLEDYGLKFNMSIYKADGKKEHVTNAGKRKRGEFGPLRRMLICLTKQIGSIEDDAIFKHWQKANLDHYVRDCNGDRWQLEAIKIIFPEGVDADQVRPEHFEYFYYINEAENSISVNERNIKTTLKRIREES